MPYFDDSYLFTDDLPAAITLEKNRGRTFARRRAEASWYLWPLEFFIKIGDAFSGLWQRSRRGEPTWDSVTFQKDGMILLKVQGTRQELELQPDSVLLVAAESGLNPAAAEAGEIFGLLGWKHVEFICKDGAHQLTLTPEACTRVYTLGVQVNPCVVGVDARHQIYLPAALKETASANQRDALLEAASRILSRRSGPALGRAIFALVGAAIFSALIVAWILARWRTRGLFYILPVAALGSVALFFSSIADGWNVKKRLRMLE